MLLFQLFSQSLQTVLGGGGACQVVFKEYFAHDQHFDFFSKCFNPQLSHNNLVALNGNGETGSCPVIFLEGHTKELRSQTGHSTRWPLQQGTVVVNALPPATVESRSRALEEVYSRTILVVQLSGICCAMQGMWAGSPVGELRSRMPRSN